MEQSVRILHVDDDPEFAELTRTVLERDSDRFAVETATDAGEGLDRLAAADYDCVLSDYEMPGMDGIEFLEAVRREHPDLPFVLFTGKGSEAVASSAISAGATDYIRKRSGTEGFELLANRIRNAVDQSRNRQRRATLERVRGIVRDVNRASIRASSREEIERRLCERLADAESYRLVVVWEVDSETKRLEARSRAGRGEGFLDGFGLCVAGESPGRQAPEGRAFHDRTVAVAGDLRTDPAYEPWRERAIEHGLRSLAVAPLEHEGELYGLLAVFADRPDAFGDDGRELLVELREDVAYAMHARDVKRKLEIALETTDAGMWEWDLDRDVVERHPTLERLLGLDSGALGTNFYSFSDRIPSEHRERVRRRYEEASRTGGTFSIEFPIRRGDGSTMWIREQGTVLTDRDGEPTRIVGTSTDVTEERERERELQRERNRFESLFETLPEPVVLVSGERAIDSTIERVNPAFEEVFGHEEEEIAGKSLNDVVVPEERREEAERIDRRSVEDGLPPTEVRRETADGELRDFLLLVTKFSVFGDDGVSDGFAIYADITEHKARERRFEEFASTVSHDLRNPLNVVDGRLELAREECDSDHLEDAARAVERMRTLIEDLLALARQGETAIEEGVVDLAAVADDCWRTVETNDATLVAATDRTVRADESRLRQLLENLLRNAVEHGGDGVTITLGDLDGGFYVEDDGSGIPAEDRERVFDSGYSTTRDGTGFGLAIASEIADAHGWEITVTDGETGGARFEIRGVELPPDRPAG